MRFFSSLLLVKPVAAGMLLSAALCGCQTAPVAVAVVAPSVAVIRPAAFSVEQIAALKGMGFAQVTDDSQDWALDFSDSKLLFDTATDTLNAMGRVTVTDIAKGLVKIGISKVRVEGHTDSEGGQALNQALSLRRAEHVARQLSQNGFVDGNVARIGFGLSKPIASNNTPQGRAQNRRVTLVVMAE